ncbi:MAG: L-seryl-tRNA(Sec) selenium transferase [Planctomycetota bacterium]|jgi:L-seryl-tRNA(Ser) seleniumtransferase
MCENPGQAALLRSLPSVDKLLKDPAVLALRDEAPRAVVTLVIRKTLDGFRRDIRLKPKVEFDVSQSAVASRVAKAVRKWLRPMFMRVVNGAGIILHTGLGRAPYCPEAVEALADAMRGYSRLAFELVSGDRQPRETVLQELLCELTGAESAQVVNNNAAATMLILNTIAEGKDVICARGQLVEIGGAFRIPDVMEMSGAKLKEVGTTNRVHLRDYENAIDENTGAILKVHTSNYRLVGFTKEIPIQELAALGKARSIPVMDDLGSGAVVDIEHLFGLDEEPLVQDSMKAGCDLVCFSGDKLMGGPQCGIILGNEDTIARIRKNPLMRALRVDKMTAIVLEQTLKVLLDEDGRLERNIVFRLLSLSQESVRARAEALRDRLASTFGDKIQADAFAVESQVGAGTTPTKALPSWAVALRRPGMPDGLFACMLRTSTVPVIGRVQPEGVLLDLRTFLEGDEDLLVRAVQEIIDKDE